jgi:hypothetical protein
LAKKSGNVRTLESRFEGKGHKWEIRDKKQASSIKGLRGVGERTLFEKGEEFV